MAPGSANPKRSGADQVRRWIETWDDHAPAFEEHFEKIRMASEFLFKARQYPKRRQEELKRQNRVTPVTLDTWDIVRYIASELSDPETIYIDVSPEVPDELVSDSPPVFDPALGDYKAPQLKPARDPKWAKWALEHDLYDEGTGFAETLDRLCFKAVATRAACGFLEWDPTQGRRGRIFLRYETPDNVIWHSDYTHPHQAGNPFVMRRRVLDYDWVVNCSGWDNVDKILPDSGVRPDTNSDLPQNRDQRLKARRVTVYYCWELYDTTTKNTLEHTHESEMLPHPEQYLACEDCAWQSGRQGSNDFPAETQCPECGGTATLIPTTGRMVPTAAYLKGKRFQIIAPRCPGAGLLADGGWPGDPPNFPLIYLVLSTDPDEIGGMSIVEWVSDLQCMKNVMFRQGFEQMIHNRDHLVTKLGAFKDAAGRPYRFDGSGEWAMFTEDDIDLERQMKHFQGSGISNALPPFVNMIDTTLRQTRGIGQLGVPPEGLKGIPVGVSQGFMESGDVPVKRMFSVTRRELSRLFTNWHAMQRNLWTVKDWVGYVGDDGEKAFEAMAGEDLPTVRMRVSGQPTIDQADMDKATKLKDLLSSVPPLPVAALKIIARVAKIPQDWIKELEQASAAPTGSQPGSSPGGPGTAPLPPPQAQMVQAAQ
jgi:hypothetical protein